MSSRFALWRCPPRMSSMLIGGPWRLDRLRRFPDRPGIPGGMPGRPLTAEPKPAADEAPVDIPGRPTPVPCWTPNPMGVWGTALAAPPPVRPWIACMALPWRAAGFRPASGFGKFTAGWIGTTLCAMTCGGTWAEAWGGGGMRLAGFWTSGTPPQLVSSCAGGLFGSMTVKFCAPNGGAGVETGFPTWSEQLIGQKETWHQIAENVYIFYFDSRNKFLPTEGDGHCFYFAFFVVLFQVVFHCLLFLYFPILSFVFKYWLYFIIFTNIVFDNLISYLSIFVYFII